LNQCFGLSAVLATDIGLERTENQDRVAALKINARSPNGRPLIVVAVADGKRHLPRRPLLQPQPPRLVRLAVELPSAE
jgi:hypothetical protein